MSFIISVLEHCSRLYYNEFSCDLIYILMFLALELAMGEKDLNFVIYHRNNSLCL